MVNKVFDALYGVFFKRMTVYVPFVLVGAYFTNEALDYSIEAFWKNHNRGKLFEDVIAAQSQE